MGFIRGTAWDSFPTTRPPTKVELSIDGGRFYPAILSKVRDQALSDAIPGGAATLASTKWLFPLRLSGYDGESIQAVARAVDEAENVGPSSAPVTIVLDSRGPVITATQTGEMLQGEVSDGSGVASMEVSLNGGAHHQPIALADGSWSFDMASWSGWPLEPFAMIRAADVWGNVTHKMIPVDTTVIPTPTPGLQLYLPIIVRGG
jgi:hypothetical protein